MPNNYKNMTPEQLRKIYDYNNKYSKDYYKNVVVKLDKRKDADLIAFLSNEPDKSGLIRKLLRDYMKNKSE